MIRPAIAAAALAAALIALVLSPVRFGADVRRAAGVTAVQLGLAPLGAAIFRPLARGGDAVAQNNLAILLNKGVGVARDPVEAARLLNAAATAGLARAQVNLLLLRSPCDSNERSRALAALEGFARAGDRRAASFLGDCLSWFPDTVTRAAEARLFLAAAEIATGSADPDEELKFGWLLMKHVEDLDGLGNAAEAMKPPVAKAAARYLLRAAEHGRAAAYEGIGLLSARALRLLADDPVAARVAAHSPDEWIMAAADAGHPRSRCTVGVKLATRLAAQGARASDADRKKLAGLFQTCLKDRDPRQVILKDGREQTIGHYRLFDVWMKDEAFLVMSPRYDDYDHDIVAQEDAVRRIVNLAQNL